MGFFKKLWGGIKKVVSAPIKLVKKVVTAPVKLVKNLLSSKQEAAPQQEIQYETEPAQQQQIAQFEAQNSMRPTSYQPDRMPVYRPPPRDFGPPRRFGPPRDFEPPRDMGPPRGFGPPRPHFSPYDRQASPFY